METLLTFRFGTKTSLMGQMLVGIKSSVCHLLTWDRIYAAFLLFQRIHKATIRQGILISLYLCLRFLVKPEFRRKYTLKNSLCLSKKMYSISRKKVL